MFLNTNRKNSVIKYGLWGYCNGTGLPTRRVAVQTLYFESELRRHFSLTYLCGIVTVQRTVCARDMITAMLANNLCTLAHITNAEHHQRLEDLVYFY